MFYKISKIFHTLRSQVLNSPEYESDPKLIPHPSGFRPGKGKDAYDHPLEIDARVKITWDDLVSRMVEFCHVHNYDEDESSCIRVCQLLADHLKKARSPAMGKHFEAELRKKGADLKGALAKHETHEDFCDSLTFLDLKRLTRRKNRFEPVVDDRSMQADYIAKQCNLDRLGVTVMALEAVATHAAGVEGNFGDEALGLIQELLNFGNRQVQDTFSNWIANTDREGRFFATLRARMEASAVWIRRRNLQTANEKFYPMDEDMCAEYDEAIQTLDFLQQICQLHHTASQNLLREQPTHIGNQDLVSDVVALLQLQCESATTLQRMEKKQAELLSKTFSILTETVQGPCARNQELIVNSEAITMAKEVLTVEFGSIGMGREAQKLETQDQHALVAQLKSRALIMIASCLERRETKVNDVLVHDKLADRVEQRLLLEIAGRCVREIEVFQCERSLADYLARPIS